MPPLNTKFPWAQSPLLVNAPMGGTAGPALASAVTRAGGIGLMGMDPTASTLDAWLDETDHLFNTDPMKLQATDTASKGSDSTNLDYLPVGVGFLVSFTDLKRVEHALSQRAVHGKRPPAILWFFAADEPATDTYTIWATTLRKLYSNRGGHVPQVWIQVGGSASAAVELALSEAKPDVLVIQGSDAGGHGMERSASLIGLLPEIQESLAAALANKPDRTPPHILASGGIVEARGALAALALGAEGVIMGTRFLASPETQVSHEEYRKRVLDARDGAQSTIRAKVFDELRGPNQWPVAYDGRALVSKSWKDMHEGGVSIETIRQGHAEAVKEQDGGYGIGSDMAVVWCGTGVGLVNEERPAGELVTEIRQGILDLSKGLHERVAVGLAPKL